MTQSCQVCSRDVPGEMPAGATFCPFCGDKLALLGGGAAAADTTTSLAAVREETPDDAALSDDDRAAVDALPGGSALLVVMRGPNAGSRFLLNEDVVAAGRHPSADVFLDDVTVSRRHAEFRRADGGFSVRDVGSLNGTYVNRDRVDEVVLGNGDEVQVGKYRLVFYASSLGFAGG